MAQKTMHLRGVMWCKVAGRAIRRRRKREVQTEERYCWIWLTNDWRNITWQSVSGLMCSPLQWLLFAAL